MANVVVGNIAKGSDIGYFASQACFTCDTLPNAQTKVATSANNISFTNVSMIVGTTIHVQFKYSNTAANPKLQVGTSDAVSISIGTNIQGTSYAPGVTEDTSWYTGSTASFTLIKDASNNLYWKMNDFKYSDKVAQNAVNASSNLGYPVLLKQSASSTDETNQVNAAVDHNNLTGVKFNPALNILHAPAVEISAATSSQIIGLISDSEDSSYPYTDTNWRTTLRLPTVTEDRVSTAVGASASYAGVLATQGMFRYKTAVASSLITTGAVPGHATTSYGEFTVVVPDFVDSSTAIRSFVFSNGPGGTNDPNTSTQHLFMEVATPVRVSSGSDPACNYMDIFNPGITANITYEAGSTHQLTVTIYQFQTTPITVADSGVIFYFN